MASYKSILGKKQPGGSLKAVEFVCRDPKQGRVFLCLCECGNKIEVPSAYFTTLKIKSCDSCSLPKGFNLPTPEEIALLAAQQEREEDLAAGLREEFYSDEFRRTWRERLAALDPLRLLLFEVIVDGRRFISMQAVDIVLRTGGVEEIKDELGSYGSGRQADAVRRIKSGSAVYQWIFNKYHLNGGGRNE